MTKRIAGFSLVLWLAASVASAGERPTLIQQVRTFVGQAAQSLGEGIDKAVATMRKGADDVAHGVPKGVSDLIAGGRKGIASGAEAVGTAWNSVVRETRTTLTGVAREIAPVGTAPASKLRVSARAVRSPILDPAFLHGRDILLAWHISTGGRPFRQTRVFDDRLLLEDDGCEIYSFDPRNGIIQWIFPLPEASQGLYRADANVVYVLSQGTLFELDRVIGLPRRRLLVPGPTSSGPTIEGNQVVIAAADRRVYAINRESRVKMWTFVPSDTVESAPAIAPNMVYAGDIGGKLVAYSPVERRIQWTYRAADAIRVPLLMQDDVLYFPSDDLNVHSVNRFGGHRVWKFPVKGSVKQQPWVEGDRVYFSAEGDALYAVQREKGELIWRSPNAGWPVAVGKQNLYVEGADQEVWALDRETGEKRWSVSAKPFTRFVRNTTSDHIYLCTDAGEIYAFYLRADHIEKKISPAEKAPPKKGAAPEPEAVEGAPKAAPKVAPKLPPPMPKTPKVAKKAEEGEEVKEPDKEKAGPAVEPKEPAEKADEKKADAKKGAWKSKAPEGAKPPGEEDEDAGKNAGKKEEKKEE